MEFGRILLTIKSANIETFLESNMYICQRGKKSYTFSPMIYLQNSNGLSPSSFSLDFICIKDYYHLPNNLLPCAGCQSLIFPIWLPQEFHSNTFTYNWEHWPRSQLSLPSLYIALEKKNSLNGHSFTQNFQWLPFLMFQPFSLFPAPRSAFRHFPSNCSPLNEILMHMLYICLGTVML